MRVRRALQYDGRNSAQPKRGALSRFLPLLVQREGTNLPILRLTQPRQAIDLRVGAWSNTGFLISGGTRIRQRVPCCWKWHSSIPHSPTSLRLASRGNFIESRAS